LLKLGELVFQLLPEFRGVDIRLPAVAARGRTARPHGPTLQHRAHGCDQLLRSGSVRDDALRPQAQSKRLVAYRSPRRSVEDKRNVSQPLVPLPLATEQQAAQRWHQQVGQDQVGRIGTGQLERRRSIGGGFEVVSAALECCPQRRNLLVALVNDQQPAHVRSRCE
jgi:hypothetical protein